MFTPSAESERSVGPPFLSSTVTSTRSMSDFAQTVSCDRLPQRMAARTEASLCTCPISASSASVNFCWIASSLIYGPWRRQRDSDAQVQRPCSPGDALAIKPIDYEKPLRLQQCQTFSVPKIDLSTSLSASPAMGLVRRTMARVLVTRERLVPTDDPAWGGGSGELSLQLTAFFTSALILASSVAVNSFSAKATGHRAPSSRFAASLKPNVAYLVLNFCALWKKQTTLPSLAYAGIPYQVFGERAGALALMIAWSRLAMARSGSGISAIFASTSLSPSALFARASAFNSWARFFIAARSSSVNPPDFLLIAVVLLADFCVSFFGLIETSSYSLGLETSPQFE